MSDDLKGDAVGKAADCLVGAGTGPDGAATMGCDQCDGMGKVRYIEDDGTYTPWEVCEDCGGSGEVEPPTPGFVSSHRRLVSVTAVAIVCAGLWALWSFAKPDPKAGVVPAYCGYYSNVLTNNAEYNGCLKHVTYKLVEDRAYRGSEAALCALGWGDCFFDDEVLDRGEQPGFNKQRYDNTPKDLVRPDDGRQNPNGQHVESKTPW